MGVSNEVAGEYTLVQNSKTNHNSGIINANLGLYYSAIQTLC